MKGFEVGDLIEARADFMEILTAGKKYKVVEFWEGGPRVISDTGQVKGLFYGRFVPVDNAAMYVKEDWS